MDITGFPAGIYSIEVRTVEGIGVKKIIRSTALISIINCGSKNKAIFYYMEIFTKWVAMNQQ